MLKLYDAHCHLQFDEIREDWAAVRRLLIERGVERCVVNATSVADWQAVRELAYDEPLVLPCYGIHPWYLDAIGSDWQAKLEAEVAASRSGIGEVGLDGGSKESMHAQEQAMLDQLSLAHQYNRPVTIHCYKAWGKLLAILEQAALPECGFLVHGFTGSSDVLRRLLELGGYISCNATLFNRNRERLQLTISAMPLERLLIETDAPEMPSPEKLREITSGKWRQLNHPANIASNYRLVSQLLGVPEQDLARQLKENFAALFGAV